MTLISLTLHILYFFSFFSSTSSSSFHSPLTHHLIDKYPVASPSPLHSLSVYVSACLSHYRFVRYRCTISLKDASITLNHTVLRTVFSTRDRVREVSLDTICFICTLLSIFLSVSFTSQVNTSTHSLHSSVNNIHDQVNDTIKILMSLFASLTVLCSLFALNSCPSNAARSLWRCLSASRDDATALVDFLWCRESVLCNADAVGLSMGESFVAVL